MKRCLTVLIGLMVLLVLLFPPSAMATRWQALADTVFAHIGKAQGLPHPIVNAITQDRTGFIWIATEYGVGRWDGHHMQVYLNDPQKLRSLPGNYVRCLLVDSQGRLWLGTQGNGLARYQPESDDFDIFLTGKGALSNLNINALADDGAGGIWVGNDGGLDHIQANGKITQFHHEASNPASLPANAIFTLLRDRDGQLWVGTNQGLVRRSAGGERGFARIAVDNGPAGGVSGIRSLMQGSDGRIWIGTANDGVFVFSPQQSGPTPQALRALGGYGQRLTQSLVYSMIEASPGQIWMGTPNHGIVVLDQQHGSIREIRHDPIFADSLANDTVLSFFRDQSGLIWIATQRGLNRYDPAQDALLTLFGSPAHETRLADVDVRSTWEDPDGRIWLGLGNHGIDILDVERGRVAALRPDVSDSRHHLQRQRVHAIAGGPDGKVYIATARGLYRSDREAHHLERVESPVRKSELSVSTLMSHNGKLWVGGANDGLWQVDGSGKLQRPDGVAFANQLQISTLLAAHDGAIWVGTWQGLYWFDPASGKVEQVTTDPHDRNLLNSPLISALMQDRSGRLWVGSSGGLYAGRGRASDGKWLFRRIGSKDGLQNQYINQLLEDKTGMVWASTDDGIVRIDPVSFAVQSVQTGTPGGISAYWAGSGNMTSKGELLFGGLGGLSVVRPEQVRPWTFQAPVVLTDLRVGGKQIGVQRYNLARDSLILPIPADANVLSVEFAVLDYSATAQTRYQFLLEGIDKDWNNTDAERRTATYANLSPGPYRLHLRAFNRSGQPGAARVLEFEVMPAWYQTWWFKLSAALGSVSLALLLFVVLLKRRTRLLREYQQQLQQLVDQRTSQLQSIQSELLAANHDLNHVNDDLALWSDTLRHLSEVGQDITAKLDINSVAAVLHRHVQSLLKVAAVALFRLDGDGHALILAQVPGQCLPDPGPLPLDGDSDCARVAKSQREMRVAGAVLCNVPGNCETVFVPLLVDQRLLGVMAIESHAGDSYGERERLIFRTLCAYGAIALDNGQAYRQVAATLKTLSDTQAQLVQQAKIASLGTLTAGVAHEINNPANFAYVGSYNLRQQLAQFHQFLLDLAGDDAPPELLEGLQQRFDQLGESLNAISEGATRIRDLVRDLRTFSRLDEADWKEVAIGDSLNATVNLVRMQFAHQVEIVCQLDANPTLTCWPAQLNQVFMNLIVNACQAIASRPEPRRTQEPGRLAIRSSISEPWLVLEFEDNGGGMSETTLQQIFDPFYTTKGVGEGMGMGLSIVLSIIEKHQGKIEVKSTLGAGSVFTLRLPLLMRQE
jgi:ligand-binding sensor domain-containing protein/signal transduction histidine kinase